MKTIIRYKNDKEESKEDTFPSFMIEEHEVVVNLMNEECIVESDDVPLDLIEQVTWVNNK